ncbi:hypothetical protein ACHAXR_007146 [Thalassiosira sp. AJA248-18]
MLRYLLFITAASNNICAASVGIRRFPAFVSTPSLSSKRSSLAVGRQQAVAFVDNNKEHSLQKNLRNIQGVVAAMTSSKNANVLSDAEAYHDMVSAAVDLANVYTRNGIVTATRSVRDIDTNSRRQFLYNIPLPSQSNGSHPFVSPPIELPTKIKARIPSPSGSKIAILVEESIPAGASESKRHVFEIWTDNGHQLANRIPLPSEKHGLVCTDFAWFGGISWSPDESAIVYTAEVNKPKTASFFTTTTSNVDDKNNTIIGGQYTLGVGKNEDWGEKYTSTALLSLFCLNVDTGNIGAIENVPGSFMAKDASSTEGGYVLGQPIFSPCGKSVVYTGWDAGGGREMPRRLGAIYCFQRPCKIYSSPVSELLGQLASPSADNDEEVTSKGDTPYVCITPNDRLARSARFSKPAGDASKLAYLCNTKGFDTHGGCMALHVSEWDMSRGSVMESSLNVVVDVVQLPGEREDETEVAGIKFPGLFLNQLPADCFSPDGKHIVTTTEWGSVNKMVSISLDDGTVSPINFDLLGEGFSDKAAQQFLCFTEDGGAIVTQSEANRPTVLGLLHPSFIQHGQGVAPSEVLFDMPPISCTSFSSSKPCTGYSYQIMNTQPSHGEVKVPVGSVLLLPENTETGEKLPLVVVPHGGPHTCMSTSYFPSYGFLCKHGRYAVLHINFRGSTGFGQAALESLAGNAGSLDVLDVVAATRAVIDAGVADPDRVGICGGSHGGFLAGHCIGQHPDLFKAAAMRNPCTNIASMVTATDIPDWCYVESIGPGHYNFSDFSAPSKEELDVMWDKSPIAHLQHVTAPTLMALGMKDKRVPPSQGIEYFHALRAKNVPTKLLVYDDCDHAIDLVVSEADFWINTKQWFDQHL